MNSIRELEKMNSNKLKKLIKELVSEGRTYEAISVLKKSGICICEYGTGKTKNYKLYMELLGYIKFNYNDIDKIKKFESEVKIFNELFKTFNKNRVLKIGEIIPSSLELNAYLMASQVQTPV